MTYPLESVLFDLDGTLIDTAPDFVICVNALRQELGKPVLQEHTIRQQVSNGARALTLLAMDLLPNGKLDDARIAELSCSKTFLENKNRLLTHYHDIAGVNARLYPGMSELMSDLDQREIPWGIVTNKPERYAIALLDKMKLHERTDILVCPDHVNKPKPAPDSIEFALNEMSLPPHSAIYIGDHERDIIAGKAANTRTIAAAYGYVANPLDCQSWGADFIAENVPEITEYLSSIN